MSNFSPFEINGGEIFELCGTPFLENSNNHQWPGLCIRDPSGALERFSKGFKRALFKKILHFVKYILHFRGCKKISIGV